MTRHASLHPPDWAPAKGYASAVVARGRTIYLGGQIGWNAKQQFETDDFVGQFAQTLSNVVAILTEGGASPEHVVRMTWFITAKQDYVTRLSEVGAVYRQIMGRHYPAMSVVVVSALIEDRAKIEIEATAVIPDA